MIRERDRARMDIDRATGGHKEELEKLRRELRFAEDKAENAERGKGSELSAMLNRHNREIADLEEALRQKQRALDDLNDRGRDLSDMEQKLREKEEEIEVFKAGMDQVLLELNQMKERQAVEDINDTQLGAIVSDNLRRIKDIIDEILNSGIQRVDDAIYELDSSMQAGNQNATGSYVLSQIEKAAQSAHDFAVAFRNLLADGANNSDNSQVIRSIHNFSGSIADVLSDTKGLTRFASDDRKADQLVNGARYAAQATIKFFRELQSFRLADLDDEQQQNVIIDCNLEVQERLSKLSTLANAFAPKSKITDKQGDLGDLVDRELTNAAKAIDAAAERLNKLMNKPRDAYSTYELKIHDSILEAAIAVTNAIALLIQAATASQQEIVAQGKGTSTRAAFYKKHNRWTEGLISAAKAVATSTNNLIETADGVISGRNSPEQLIVASNDVAASTAQLVAASRVKASLMSKTQERLESASRQVTGACRHLVRQVQDIIAQRNRDEGDHTDYAALTSHELKTQEMEQQVRFILYLFSCRRLLANPVCRLRFSSWRTRWRRPGRGSAR
jgi:huntingtin-interacting protein 1-related protein